MEHRFIITYILLLEL